MTENSELVDDAEVESWFEDELESGADVDAPLSTDPGEKYAASQLRVVRETKDYTLDYLQHALQPGRELIDISPAFQRRLRWTNKKKSLLIESFLLNIPVPPIFLFERDYNEYEVIDGRQRLDAVSSFLSNDFALTGLEYWPELNRRRFRELPNILQKGMLRRSLPAVVLLAETRGTGQNDLDVRRVLFDRLNTGGIRLNPQELRNALYPGPFNALLISLARSQTFSSTWLIPPFQPNEAEQPSEALLKNAIYASLADAELVLRFFALRDAVVEGRAGSLRSVLDRFMERVAEGGGADLEEMKVQFESCLARLFELFEGAPFRLPTTRRPSRPLYDALMIALSISPGLRVEEHAEPIRAALAEALDDPEQYEILVGRGNTIESIKERVTLAGEILRTGESQLT